MKLVKECNTRKAVPTRASRVVRESVSSNGPGPYLNSANSGSLANRSDSRPLTSPTKTQPDFSQFNLGQI